MLLPRGCMAILPLMLLLHAAGSAARALPPEVEQALQRERIAPESVAVVVQEVGHGAVRIAHNAAAPMNPASVVKLLTTYAALDTLGPAFAWKTPVWFAGPLRGNMLDGDLVLRGRGDPKLTLERLWLALQRVRQMGVSEIRGDIVLDQSAFAVPEGSTADFDNEPHRPYNARAQALLLNLNAVLYTFTPDAARGVARVSAEPVLDDFAVDATVPLGNGPCGDWRAALKATPHDPRRMQFAGTYPLACGERVWPLAHADAKSYAQRLLASLWREGGGKLAGSVREGAAPTLAPTFELTSPSLAEVVRDINKYSNNVMAQQLFLTLALQRFPALPATPDDARRMLERWLVERLGETPASMAGVVIDNGSGLSRQSRLSAALLARLLQSAWSSPVMPELMASLPVTGLDGTLRRSRGEAAGRAHLKTGSLRDVAALGGYVLGASGKRYVLVAIVNHPNAGASRAAFDALVQWTADDAAGAAIRGSRAPSRSP